MDNEYFVDPSEVLFHKQFEDFLSEGDQDWDEIATSWKKFVVSPMGVGLLEWLRGEIQKALERLWQGTENDDRIRGQLDTFNVILGTIERMGNKEIDNGYSD